MSRGASRIGAVVGVLAAAALALPGAAAADTEPNSAVFTPEGPIVGGQDIGGTVGPGDTDDWYVAHVEGSHQLHLISSDAQPFGDCVSIRLTNADGSPLANDYTSPAGESTFHVHVSLEPLLACGDTAYSFRLDPAEAVVAGPGRLPVKGANEPDDSRADASGPLAPGAWYHSKLETVNDQDWMRLYTRPGVHRLDVQVLAYGTGCPNHYVRLTTARGREIAGYVGTRPTIAHLTARRRGPERLYVQVTTSESGPFQSPGCLNTPTVVQVGPETAVMSVAEANAICRKGRRLAPRAARRAAVTARALARARAQGRATRALRRKLQTQRRTLRTARRLASVYC